MPNISGHDVEITTEGENIVISGSGAKALHAQLKNAVNNKSILSEVENDRFSFNLEALLDDAITKGDTNHLNTIQEIYAAATEDTLSKMVNAAQTEQTAIPEVKTVKNIAKGGC